MGDPDPAVVPMLAYEDGPAAMDSRERSAFSRRYGWSGQTEGSLTARCQPARKA